MGFGRGAYPAPSSTPSLYESAQACPARPHGLPNHWQMKGKNPITKGKEDSFHEWKEPFHGRKESFHERKESSQDSVDIGTGCTTGCTRWRRTARATCRGSSSVASSVTSPSHSEPDSVRVRVSHEPCHDRAHSQGQGPGGAGPTRPDRWRLGLGPGVCRRSRGESESAGCWPRVAGRMGFPRRVPVTAASQLIRVEGARPG